MKNKLSILFLLCLINLFSNAQDTPSTWYEIEFSKKIIKNLKLELNPKLKLKDDFEMDSYFIETGLSYKLTNYLSIGGFYRFVNEYNYRDKREVYEWEPVNRWIAEAKSGFVLDRFDFQLRLRYVYGQVIEDEEEDQESNMRYRAKVNYDIKGSKFEPYATIEAMHNLDEGLIDRLRFTGGMLYNLNKKNAIELYYSFQSYLDSDDKHLHIIGIGYCLKF